MAEYLDLTLEELGESMARLRETFDRIDGPFSMPINSRINELQVGLAFQSLVFAPASEGYYIGIKILTLGSIVGCAMKILSYHSAI
jgi:hypothetical protein